MAKRRKHGDGSIHLRKDGRWEGRVVIGYDEKGLPKTKNVLAKTKTECVAKLKALRERLEAPAPEAPKPSISLGDWLDHWYQDYKKANLRPNTQMSYERRIYQHIIPALGHIQLDKLTTLMLYVLRLIYEEEREKLSLSRDIFTTTGDLVHKMISLGVIKRKPANLSLRDSLRTLNRFRIVEKMDGPWENADTRLLILPAILFVVTNERISNMYQLIDEEGEHEETEEDAADSLA